MVISFEVTGGVKSSHSLLCEFRNDLTILQVFRITDFLCFCVAVRCNAALLYTYVL